MSYKINKGDKMESYKIVRMYRESGKKSRTITQGLSLEEAQEHCNRPDTRKESVWFDGYSRE